MVKIPWTITIDKTRMLEKPPLGPGFSIDEAEQADSMSISFSDSNESGEDRATFTLHAADGSVIETKTTINILARKKLQ
jgi:hypothetical protein